MQDLPRDPSCTLPDPHLYAGCRRRNAVCPAVLSIAYGDGESSVRGGDLFFVHDRAVSSVCGALSGSDAAWSSDRPLYPILRFSSKVRLTIEEAQGPYKPEGCDDEIKMSE